MEMRKEFVKDRISVLLVTKFAGRPLKCQYLKASHLTYHEPDFFNVLSEAYPKSYISGYREYDLSFSLLQIVKSADIFPNTR